jgi:hypothetical protein
MIVQVTKLRMAELMNLLAFSLGGRVVFQQGGFVQLIQQDAAQFLLHHGI